MSLEVVDLSVTLGGRRLIEEISFSARPGEVTVIVGPNGSGKTTLLRAVTGEVRYAGQVTLNGLDVARAAPGRLAAWRAVLPQKVALAFPFTAYEVVRLGLSFGADPDPALPARALAAVGLSALAERPYQLLSGGEQARVQLARALVQVWTPVLDGRPRWLFLDEPVASLDIGHQLQVMRIARSYADRGGGVVAVMHDLNLTAMFADRTLLLSAGRLAAQGRPHEVITTEWLSRAYGCHLPANSLPASGGVYVLPQAASETAPA